MDNQSKNKNNKEKIKFLEDILAKISNEEIKMAICKKIESLKYDLEKNIENLKLYYKNTLNNKQKIELNKYDAGTISLLLDDSNELLVKMTKFRETNKRAEYGHDSEGYENFIPWETIRHEYYEYYLLSVNGELIKTSEKSNYKSVDFTSLTLLF
jgi:hypothetical protein